MGLDSVELIMRIEKDFDIHIKDSDAEQLNTVGKLHDAVWERLENKRSESCLTQPIFYNLRRAFVEELNVKYEHFVPAARMEEIVPLDQRRKHYLQLSKQFGYTLPKLVLNNALSTANTSIGISIFVLAAGIALNHSLLLHGTGFWWLLLIPTIFLIMGVNRAFEPFRDRFGYATLREFVNRVLVLNSRNMSQLGISRKEMEFVVNSIISDQLGADMEEITPEKSFTTDLGID